MIAKISVDISQAEPISVEQFDVLKQFYPDSYKLRNRDERPTFFYGEECICDVDAAIEKLLPLGISPKIVSLAPNVMVTRMKDRISELVAEGILDELQQLKHSGIVQITIPDMGLLLLDEVQHLDDSCTDELQRQLDDGWRILAVCPPNSARRPDYILGRRSKR